jgi:hypothetical protein
MEVQVTESLANMKSRIMKNSVNMKSQATENLANTKSRVTENLVNTKTRLYRTRGRGARNRKKEKVLLQAEGQLHSGAQGVLSRHKNVDCKRCVKESWPRKKEEEEGDYWFNRLLPMTKQKQTW